MRKMIAAGISLSLGAAMLVALPASQTMAQELSERSIKTIMAYAWSYTPDKFTPPNGKTVFIDKQNPKKMMVPIAKGRDVIKVGRLTAHAQICDLREDQVNNYRSLMLREQKSKKWTPQQIVYITAISGILLFVFARPIHSWATIFQSLPGRIQASLVFGVVLLALTRVPDTLFSSSLWPFKT